MILKRLFSRNSSSRGLSVQTKSTKNHAPVVKKELSPQEIWLKQRQEAMHSKSFIYLTNILRGNREAAESLVDYEMKRRPWIFWKEAVITAIEDLHRDRRAR